MHCFPKTKILSQEKVLKESIYDDVLDKFDIMLGFFFLGGGVGVGGGKLIYYISNNRIVWRLRAPNEGLATPT